MNHLHFIAGTPWNTNEVSPHQKQKGVTKCGCRTDDVVFSHSQIFMYKDNVDCGARGTRRRRSQRHSIIWRKMISVR